MERKRNKNLQEWEAGIHESNELMQIGTNLAEALVTFCGWEWGYGFTGRFKASQKPNVVFSPERKGVQRCFGMNELLTTAGMDEVFHELVTRGLWEPFFRVWLDNRESDPIFFEEGPPLSIGIFTVHAFMKDQKGKGVAAWQTLVDKLDRKEG